MDGSRLNFFLMSLNMKIDEELAVNGEISPVLIEMARYGLLKFGRISVPYIMRKLKVSESTAKIIVTSLMKAT
jgi:hypothetical protein